MVVTFITLIISSPLVVVVVVVKKADVNPRR